MVKKSFINEKNKLHMTLTPPPAIVVIVKPLPPVDVNIDAIKYDRYPSKNAHGAATQQYM